MLSFTSSLVEAELPLTLVQPFNCLVKYVLLNCINPENNGTGRNVLTFITGER